MSEPEEGRLSDGWNCRHAVRKRVAHTVIRVPIGKKRIDHPVIQKSRELAMIVPGLLMNIELAVVRRRLEIWI